jgi:hypothetical protein
MNMLWIIQRLFKPWEVKAIRMPIQIQAYSSPEMLGKAGTSAVLPEVTHHYSTVYMLTKLVVYMNSIKNTASSGNVDSFSI